MIEVEESFALNMSAEACLAFLKDFTNLPLWDPGIESAEAQGEGQYSVVAKFLGRRAKMHYVLLEERSDYAQLCGQGKGVIATDHIHVEPIDDGRCALTWRAEFEFKMLPSPLDRVMKPLMLKYSDDAMAGLRRYDAARAHWAADSKSSG